jgi:glycosyltransferase involved in cell wall biosynthesis
MMPTPFFSIIIPTYNRSERIYPTLDSVLSQTELDFELIIVDDGSTDDTYAVLEGYAGKLRDDRIRVIRRENGGTTAARNSGIAAARGQYILLLDHDDLFLPWTLQTHRQAIALHGAVAFCAGTVEIKEPQAVSQLPPQTRRFNNLFESPFESLPIYPSGWAIRAEQLRAVGGFFPYNIGLEDLDLLLRLGTAPGFVRVTQPTLALRGIHGANLSSPRHILWFIKGLRVLVEREKADQYPGGGTYAAVRRDLICSTGRTLSTGCANYGLTSEAFWFYRNSFRWQMRRGRLKYILALPVLAAVRRIKSKKND